MPIEFVIFGITLLGVAIFHRRALAIAAAGLAAVIIFEWLFTQFPGARVFRDSPGTLRTSG